jgi:hypothetical protein
VITYKFSLFKWEVKVRLIIVGKIRQIEDIKYLLLYIEGWAIFVFKWLMTFKKFENILFV